MKVILPKFDVEDSIDLSALTDDYLVIAFRNGKPHGVLCTNDEGEYWIQEQTNTSYKCNSAYDSLYEAVEDYICQYPDVTFEAYL